MNGILNLLIEARILYDIYRIFYRGIFLPNSITKWFNSFQIHGTWKGEHILQPLVGVDLKKV